MEHYELIMKMLKRNMATLLLELNWKYAEMDFNWNKLT